MACLRVHGMEPKYYHKYIGWNARLDALQAALLRVKLPHLDRWIEAGGRRPAATTRLIEEHHLGHFLRRPVVRPNRRHTFNQYVVRVADGQRDALVGWLKAERIGCEIYYPMPLHLQECLASSRTSDGRIPRQPRRRAAACWRCRCSRRSRSEQQRRVVGSCAAFVRKSHRMAA